ncbi:hypothetical protein, partial [Janthinobacterium sp.]|uniref:hypothetical protein n=1 Tax=Janthinobacterium sp. TaxID=1871054 RepID=UPI00261AA0EA
CYFRAIDKALCLSAAKKEEYEAIRYVRQLLLFLCFTLHLHASFSRGRIIAKTRRRRKGYLQIPPSQPHFTSACVLCSLSHLHGASPQLAAEWQHPILTQNNDSANTMDIQLNLPAASINSCT